MLVNVNLKQINGKTLGLITRSIFNVMEKYAHQITKCQGFRNRSVIILLFCYFTFSHGYFDFPLIF